MILEEFDPGRAVIEPDEVSDAEVGEVCDTLIMPFSGQLFDQLVDTLPVRLGGFKSSINGKQPWYIYEVNGQKFGLMKALLGAPALVGFLEEMQAAGFKNFVIFGTCGVLDGSLPTNKLIIPTSSVRDEGTSYHYAPASSEIAYPAEHLAAFQAILDKHQLPYITTKAWTTDAFFRETPAKVERRKAQGCRVVDMEWSAVCAWAQFRQKQVYHFFYTSDFVNSDGPWDKRGGHSNQDLMTFFEIALTIAKELR